MNSTPSRVNTSPYQFERSRIGFAQRPLFPLGAMDLRELPLLFLPDHSGGFTRRKERLPDKGAAGGAHERSNPEQPELTNCGGLREEDDRSRSSRVDGGIGHRNRNQMSVSPNPIAIGAKPAGAAFEVDPRMMTRKAAVRKTSATRHDSKL